MNLATAQLNLNKVISSYLVILAGNLLYQLKIQVLRILNTL